MRSSPFSRLGEKSGLEGRIIHALGQFAEAAFILRQVQEEFRARDFHLDFLFISIDLAESHMALGEPATALRLASEATPILASWKPHRRVVAAWLLFQKTLQELSETGANTGALFSRLRLYYRRYWHAPEAEFSPR